MLCAGHAGGLHAARDRRAEALVVASSADSGGTWAGATEALRHGRVKVLVKSSGVLAPGNPKLMRMGGIPFPAGPWEDLRSLFTAPEEKNGQLFSATRPQFPAAVERSTEAVAASPPDALPAGEQAVAAQAPPVELCRLTEAKPACDAYTLVIDAVLALLKEPRADEWLADKMCVRAAQMKDWLDRGVGESRILKLKKPVRYVAHTPSLLPGESYPALLLDPFPRHADRLRLEHLVFAGIPGMDLTDCRVRVLLSGGRNPSDHGNAIQPRALRRLRPTPFLTPPSPP